MEKVVISDVAMSRWCPEWTTNTRAGSPVGIARDDHCFVVLSFDLNGQWQPIKHIPSVAAELIGELASKGALNY